MRYSEHELEFTFANKTETKQFCFSFISDVVTCELKQKQNTETILKRFNTSIEIPKRACVIDHCLRLVIW